MVCYILTILKVVLWTAAKQPSYVTGLFVHCHESRDSYTCGGLEKVNDGQARNHDGCANACSCPPPATPLFALEG